MRSIRVGAVPHRVRQFQGWRRRVEGAEEGADLVEVLLQGQEIVPIRLPLWCHAVAPRCVPAGCPRHGSVILRFSTRELYAEFE